MDVYIEFKGKKIPRSNKNWEELMRKRVGSCVVVLTTRGMEIARKLRDEIDPDIVEIIQKTKEELNFMDTERLKDKVHKEYPEWKMNYVENDVENFRLFQFFIPVRE